MNKTVVGLIALFFCFTASAYTQTHTFYDEFVITQTNPEVGTTTVGNLIQPAPEIAYFEDAADIGLFNFNTSDMFAVYTALLMPTGITGGAADMLGITSSSSLGFSATSSATMSISSFNGTDHVFDPLFSQYNSLVFDVRNIGSSAVDLLFNIGPSASTSAIYTSLDEFFMPIPGNVVAVAPDETVTFTFYLGMLANDPSVVWDYANGPYNEFYLDIQPQIPAAGFEIMVDNIGMVPVPEPGAMMLCLFGLVVSKFVWKKKK